MKVPTRDTMQEIATGIFWALALAGGLLWIGSVVDLDRLVEITNENRRAAGGVALAAFVGVVLFNRLRRRPDR